MVPRSSRSPVVCRVINHYPISRVDTRQSKKEKEKEPAAPSPFGDKNKSLRPAVPVCHQQLDVPTYVVSNTPGACSHDQAPQRVKKQPDQPQLISLCGSSHQQYLSDQRSNPKTQVSNLSTPLWSITMRSRTWLPAIAKVSYQHPSFVATACHVPTKQLWPIAKKISNGSPPESVAQSYTSG